MRLSGLCEILSRYGMGARLDGEDRTVRAVNTLEDAAADELSFITNPKYTAAATRTRAMAVVVKDDAAPLDGKSLIRCPDPYAAVTVAIIAIHGYRKHPHWGLSDRAVIDPTAKIGRNPNIAPGDCGHERRDRRRLHNLPGGYIADHLDSATGARCFQRCRATLRGGDRVTIHAGSVIGQDGLGYARIRKWIRFRRSGGPSWRRRNRRNCAIDRTLGQMRSKDEIRCGGDRAGTVSDCIFVGQVGVAGSVTVGRNVTLRVRSAWRGICRSATRFASARNRGSPRMSIPARNSLARRRSPWKRHDARCTRSQNCRNGSNASESWNAR